MTQMLELSDKNFQAAIIKMFHEKLQIHFKQMKYRKSHQRNRIHKALPNGNFRNKNYNSQSKKLDRWIWFHVQNVRSLEVVMPILKTRKKQTKQMKFNDFSWTH